VLSACRPEALALDVLGLSAGGARVRAGCCDGANVACCGATYRRTIPTTTTTKINPTHQQNPWSTPRTTKPNTHHNTPEDHRQPPTTTPTHPPKSPPQIQNTRTQQPNYRRTTAPSHKVAGLVHGPAPGQAGHRISQPAAGAGPYAFIWVDALPRPCRVRYMRRRSVGGSNGRSHPAWGYRPRTAAPRETKLRAR
jgi:hypothetical protein